jgi:hypothetical protein
MGELCNSDEFIERLSKMMDSIEARAQQAEARAEQAQQAIEQAQQAIEQAQQATAQAQQATAQAEAQALAEARQSILDLAEAYGLEISAARQQQVQGASLAESHALRLALKATHAWPAPSPTPPGSR